VSIPVKGHEGGTERGTGSKCMNEILTLFINHLYIDSNVCRLASIESRIF
jgi:hypothetical protein